MLELLIEFGILDQVLVFVHLLKVILELQILKFEICDFFYLDLKHLLESRVHRFAAIRGFGKLSFLVDFLIIGLGFDGGENWLLILLLFKQVFEFLKFNLLFL